MDVSLPVAFTSSSLAVHTGGFFQLDTDEMSRSRTSRWELEPGTAKGTFTCEVFPSTPGLLPQGGIAECASHTAECDLESHTASTQALRALQTACYRLAHKP